MKFKVLRDATTDPDGQIHVRVGKPEENKWSFPKKGDLIDLSEAAAGHLLSTDPPYVEAQETDDPPAPVRPRKPRARSAKTATAEGTVSE
jgi:hypothetical protein